MGTIIRFPDRRGGRVGATDRTDRPEGSIVILPCIRREPLLAAPIEMPAVQRQA